MNANASYYHLYQCYYDITAIIHVFDSYDDNTKREQYTYRQPYFCKVIREQKEGFYCISYYSDEIHVYD